MIYTRFYPDGVTAHEVFDTDAMTYTAYDIDGVSAILFRDLTPIEATMALGQPAAQIIATNNSTLRQRAQTALSLNTAYLALSPPTNAQAIQQVTLLTRECSALIRLVLDQLDSTDGT